MKLSELIENIPNLPRMPGDLDIAGLSLDSKSVKPNYLFFALSGSKEDGHHHIEEAIKKGAVIVLAEAGKVGGLPSVQHNIPIITVRDLKNKVGLFAQKFYANNSKLPCVIGVTGTNGKTTCTYLLGQCFVRLRQKSAVIGTLGYGLINDDLKKTGLTTPDALSLHRYLHDFAQQGIEKVSLEVSSHALHQGRVEGLPFESAIFTNLSQDHLDYHGTMEHYGAQKLKLFLKPGLRRVILNADDKYTANILRHMRRDIPVILFSLNPEIKNQLSVSHPFVSWVIATQYNLSANGATATVSSPWGEGVLHTQLLGEFNISNALAVLSELCMQGFSLAESISALKQVQPAPGRMQRLGGIHTAQIIVDYAHTPDALEKALISARKHCKRRLWCVFGCGGDRDASKRSQMGQIAAQLADRVILTNDNPRTENPRQIIGDIMQGMHVDQGYKVLIEEDRKKAIEHAVYNALPVDTVLIAGKGHEDTQTIGKTEYPFSDIEWVQQLTGAKQSA